MVDGIPAIQLTQEDADQIMNPGKWNFMADFKANLPEHWVSMTQLPGMQAFYPFDDDAEYALEPLVIETGTTPEMQAALEHYLDYRVVNGAFKKFWSTFMPHMPQTGVVLVYSGLVGKTDAVYIRYEQDHVKPMTFVLDREEFTYFLSGWTQAIISEHMQVEMEEWCKFATSNEDFKKRGFRYNLTGMAVTYPLSWFFYNSFNAKGDLFAGLTNGDFKLMDGFKKQFVARFDSMVSEATHLAVTLKDKVKFKDHNLMLAFKANESFTGILIGLDKIFPKFPEGGQVECGLTPIDPAEWAKEGDNVQVVIRKLIKLNTKINNMILKILMDLPDNEWCRQTFLTLVKERMIASSHFLKELYQANPTDIRPYVESKANEILGALNERGGNIGLDLTSWVVYQYFTDGRPPVPLVADGLNFKQELYNMHTERFMEVLYQYLFHVRSPFIRPYVHRVVADLSDGIPVGSIRPVEQAQPVVAVGDDQDEGVAFHPAEEL